MFKLCQTTTVNDYQSAFEALANRIVGLPPQFYLNCFISGLKPAIRREVQAFQPTSLPQAISLAKLQEDKLGNCPNPFPNRRPENTPPQSSQTPTTNFTHPNRSRPALTTVPSQNTVKPATPIKRLSPAELRARRDKGLCYNCDELYHTSHRCRRQFHLLIAEPEPAEHGDDPASQLLLHSGNHSNQDNPTQPDANPTQISLHALMCHTDSSNTACIGPRG